MRLRALVVCVVSSLAVVTLVGVVGASTNPAAKCAASKQKAAGKKAAAKLKCYAKATRDRVPVSTECLQKAEEKFTTAFLRAEAKGGCIETDDAEAIEAGVDAFVADVVTQLPSTCGNGLSDPGEDCDPPGSTCSPSGTCYADCTCQATQAYYIDVTVAMGGDGGDDPDVAGCHWGYSNPACTQDQLTKYGDRCMSQDPRTGKFLDLTEWTNTVCHPVLPLDSKTYYCDARCKIAGNRGGHCETIANHCGANIDSAKCICTN